eukprot:scaffold42847_cov13-Tisochrysis_lutea.AAC.1
MLMALRCFPLFPIPCRSFYPSPLLVSCAAPCGCPSHSSQLLALPPSALLLSSAALLALRRPTFIVDRLALLLHRQLLAFGGARIMALQESGWWGGFGSEVTAEALMQWVHQASFSRDQCFGVIMRLEAAGVLCSNFCTGERRIAYRS